MLVIVAVPHVTVVVPGSVYMLVVGDQGPVPASLVARHLTWYSCVAVSPEMVCDVDEPMEVVAPGENWTS